jgi:3,4-dihydroxy 2-butanone 4-phosphate synthase/GTP cyclohydrolase II
MPAVRSHMPRTIRTIEIMPISAESPAIWRRPPPCPPPLASAVARSQPRNLCRSIRSSCASAQSARLQCPLTFQETDRVALASIPDILAELRAGRMVVLIDDEQRENEGDLIAPAQSITPEQVNFMTKHARGVLCVAMDGLACDRLELTPQTPHNTAALATAFTVTVDAHRRFGVTTGVSAADRAATIRLLADPASRPADFARPGHINPLRARDGGVLVRTGQTEGSVDLCRLAGLQPACAIIEIMNDDGSMARLPQLQQLCLTHGLKMCSVADVVAFRMAREKLVHRVGTSDLQTPHGSFQLIAYRSPVDPLLHLALVKGPIGQEDTDHPVLVRVHAENLLGDLFDDSARPSRRVLHRSMRMIEQEGAGVVLYLRQDVAGASLLKQMGLTLPEADPAAPRVHEGSVNIGVGSQILRDLGVRQLRLITDHPQHYRALEGFGLTITQFVPVGDREPSARGCH